ncbi:hypothetical protein [Rhizorhapis suberifaciens]|uniref:Lipoprotein n=1 Tax=Rhizorhapis suberifaciens TaxID=13656 RepID=A0A840HT00_9SPHN|nr:hypothetical protein [Rhizorhapis suberifaciens]MBB4640636.1 hypothetical protein [Rhizorhapis suberifaciens]
MIDRRFVAASLALPLILSACVSAPVSKAPTSVPDRSAAAYGKAPVGLAGADARKLVALFGQPRLDVRERTVRKLQFSNGRCVLDAYLYVLGNKREPVVTHVDTRLATGADVDQNSCIQSLRAE